MAFTTVSLDIPFPTTTTSALFSTSTVAASLIASVTDGVYPAEASCTAVLGDSPWLQGAVGRTPVTDDFWNQVVQCCDGAPIEIWATDSACESFCYGSASNSSSAQDIYNCLITWEVDYFSGVECDYCNPDTDPSQSIEAVAVVPTSLLGGDLSSTAFLTTSISSATTTKSSTTSSVTSSTLTKSSSTAKASSSASVTAMTSSTSASSTSSASTSSHSGAASRGRLEVGALGMALLGLAAL